MDALKKWLADNGYELAAEASTDDIKAVAQRAIKEGALSLDEYADLVAGKPAEDKVKQLTASVADEVTERVKAMLAESTAGKTDEPAEQPKDESEDWKKRFEDLETKFKERMAGTDGAAAIGKLVAAQADETDDIRVKNPVEKWDHTKSVGVYRKHAYYKGQQMRHNDRPVFEPTQRTRAMSAAWFKFQALHEWMTENDTQIVKHILATEPFYVPNSEGVTDARLLTEAEREAVWKLNTSNKATTLVDDATSGGAYAVPEFFDMDMIITPVLSDEDIPSYCNIVDVPRGSSAQNFIVGNLTIAAANTEGSAVTPFTTDGFLTNHDTSFFRAAGFVRIGRNWELDAHPGLAAELLQNYQRAFKLWLNEQIVAGDGTTEPQGILNASGTTDVTPSSPTTGAQVLTDWTALLFGVGKAYRNRGGRQNAIYIMTDTTYRRAREIATGVTGDTRFVFGDDVESYRLFNHPTLIEESGLSNNHGIFAQMKGYRLYRRQGLRFIQEDRGDTWCGRTCGCWGLTAVLVASSTWAVMQPLWMRFRRRGV